MLASGLKVPPSRYLMLGYFDDVRTRFATDDKAPNPTYNPRNMTLHSVKLYFHECPDISVLENKARYETEVKHCREISTRKPLL